MKYLCSVNHFDRFDVNVGSVQEMNRCAVKTSSSENVKFLLEIRHSEIEPIKTVLLTIEAVLNKKITFAGRY